MARIRLRGGKGGFTLIELMITIVIVGILAGIATPVMSEYRLRAESTVFKSVLKVLMDGQDAQFMDKGYYYPKNGVVNIPRGVGKSIPEIGYTFPPGHKHRYLIYGYNREYRNRSYHYYYIMVYADEDFNRNGYDDILLYITYYYNGRLLYHRQKFTYR